MLTGKTSRPTFFAEQKMLKPPPYLRALKSPPTAAELESVRTFEDKLMSGILLEGYFNKLGRQAVTLKSLRNCRTFMCISGSDNKRIGVMDIRNLQMTKDSLRFESAHPKFDSVPCTPPTYNRSVFELKEALEGLHMLQKIYNSVEPFDEQLTVPCRLFCCTFPNSTASLEEFSRFAAAMGYQLKGYDMILSGQGPSSTITGSNEVGYSKLVLFVKWSLANRQEVIETFNKYSRQQVAYSQQSPDPRLMQPLMTIGQFIRFLTVEQLQTPVENEKTLRKFSAQHDILRGVSVYAFGRYLYSNINNAFHPRLRRIYQNMGRPLNQYYCYSSHNTYLTGNQLNSVSSIERYVEDLEMGVRSVEIDVHNALTYIKVTHGFTRTTNINFEDVVRVLARFSERNPNHLPIMLSIEVHLNWRNKQVLVDILLHYLGRKIFIIEKDFVQYPSALELRNKILVKTYEKISESLKKRLENCQVESKKEVKFMKESVRYVKKLFDLDNEATANMDQLFIPVEIEKLKEIQSTSTDKQIDIENTLSRLKQDSLDWNVLKKWIMEDPMTCMNKITSMYKSANHRQQPNFFEYINGDWYTLIKRAREEPASLVRYTSKGWCRVYPYGLQFLSANYNPIPFLEIGAQIISLNTQARETFRYIQHAHFSENYCGYLLKPKNLIEGKFVQKTHVQFQIRVVGAQNIRLKKTQEPFEYDVRMGFFGKMVCYSGSVIDCKPENRNGEVFAVTETVRRPNVCFQFSYVHTLELWQPYFSFVMLEVTGLGCNVIPVRVMRSGYRSVQLLDKNFKPVGSACLLVWVKIAELSKPTT